MKRTRRASSPRSIRLISLALCYALIVTTVFLPLSKPVSARAESDSKSASSSRGLMQGFIGAPGRLLAAFLTMVQGGGLPSVPGPNLPDLDAARGVQAAEPEAQPPIASSQPNPDICEDCEPGNQPPTSDPGGPYSGSATQPIQFDGLRSSDDDPGDGISAYVWSFGDNTATVSGATPSHTYQSAGNFIVSLTVTDHHNASNTATATVSVSAPPTPTPTPSPSPSPSPSPAQTNAATFVSQTAPATMTAGSRYAVSVTMRNTGETTWSAAHLYRLGSQGDNSLWGRSRVYLRSAVVPGAEVTFSFMVVAPYSGVEEPGPANFQWRMVQDGVEWFGDSSQNQSVTIVSNYQAPNGDAPVIGPFSDLFASRIAPQHRTGRPGEDLLSGNYNWGIGLVGLSGRAGLNLNLGLSYNSLATWTKVEPPYQPLLPPISQEPMTWTFDADRGFPSAGFRLGFPTIQGPFVNNQTGTNAYLMLMPSGARVELRQVESANVYEAVDSSYLQLTDDGSSGLRVLSTDGTRMLYSYINGQYHCTEVKDRNGNYITINYDGTSNPGRMTSVIDTLGRTINFAYDRHFRLQTISQLRNGQSHVWASFGYSDVEIWTNFERPEGFVEQVGETVERNIGVLGLPDGGTVSLLTQVSLDDGSRYDFDYTSWGQVYSIRHSAADGHQLNYTSYDLPLEGTSQTDCPRFTERQDWAENWNNDEPVTTNFQINPDGQWGEMTAAAGTSDQVTYKEFFGTEYTDWRRGLVTRTEIHSGTSNTLRKTTITDWTQDNTNVAYPLNPRPTAATISDAEGNRNRTTIEYTSFGLPSDVYEMGPYGTTDWRTLRRTHNDYNLSEAYINRRIIGRVSGQYLFGPDAPDSYSVQTLLSKKTSEYDVDIGFCGAQICLDGTTGQEHQSTDYGEQSGGGGSNSVVQHDSSYGQSFTIGRGDLTRVTRWDVNHEMEGGVLLTSTLKYNTLGSVVVTTDPAGHATSISYGDSFSNDGTTDNTAPYVTMAYPTRVTDPDGYSSTAKFNYDLGVVTRREDPKGAAQTTEYDSAGRIKRVTNAVNLAYTRFVYPASQTIVNKFTTIQEDGGEAYSATVFDGAGRVRAVAGDFPDLGGIDHYSGQYTLYDVMGRAIQQTNPTEMTHVWAAVGDDAGGWISSLQTYDWKGRPLLTTHPSITDNPNDTTTTGASYGGCGCAGGEVVTLTDEGTMDTGVFKRRQQKIYSDPLGRTIKTEVFNWQGGSVYSATANTYNGRDQITLVRQYQGGEGSGVYQDTTMTYDGYGRLKTKHVPAQDANTATAYDYYADDTVLRVTDARGATTTLDYNGRSLVKSLTYGVPAGVAATPNVAFEYDPAGNRLWMTDGAGRMDYEYDTLSRMTSETRTFSDPTNPTINGLTKAISYDYNLAGQLKKMTDSTNMTIKYGHDTTGRLNSVTGSDTLYAGVSNYASNLQYRAWGGLKGMTDGKGYVTSVQYNAKLQPSHFQISSNMVSQDYEYNNDGRIRVVHNTTDQNFDRSYSYDHAGRLTEAKSGGDVNGYQYAPIPYHETFGYDAFSNLKARQSQSWNGQTDNSDAATYSNNRRGGWGYDADGRNTTIDTRTNTFDAAGQQTAMNATAIAFNGSSYTVNQAITHDGDGAMVKEVDTQSNAPGYANTTYYLRSSVLGGAIIEELSSGGQKNVGYVYSPGGQLLATQQPNNPNMVTWKHSTPAGTTQFTVNTYNAVTSRTEFDPLGANFSLTAPEEPPPGEGDGDVGAGHFAGLMDSRWSDYLNLSGGCSLDGVRTSCNMAMVAINLNSGYDEGEFHCFGVACDTPANDPPKTPDNSISIHEAGRFSSLALGYLMDTPPDIGNFVVRVPISFEPLSISGVYFTANGGLIPLYRSLEPPQDPLQSQRIYKVEEIVRKARERANAEKLNKQAWDEFIHCVSTNPTVIAANDEYQREWNKIYFESWDVEGKLMESSSEIGYHAYKHYRKYKAIRLATRANVFTLATTFIMGALLSGVPLEVNRELLKKEAAKVNPVRDECLRDTANKYGFTPTSP